jgi:hypothetical protein
LVLNVFLLLRFLDAPTECNDHARLRDGHDLGLSVCDLETGLELVAGNAVAKDLTGLVRTVSAGRSAPPEVTPLHTPPLEIRGEKCDKRLDVAVDRRIQRLLHALRIRSVQSALLATLEQIIAPGDDALPVAPVVQGGRETGRSGRHPLPALCGGWDECIFTACRRASH